MTDTTNKITTRIFAGCLITAELRMYLNFSIEWKHAALASSSKILCFQEMRCDGKNFFGFYIEHKSYKISELDEIQNQIRAQLKAYCPKFEAETVNICIIPQVFVA